MVIKDWIQENTKAIRLVITWLIFIAALTTSVSMGDFRIYSDQDSKFVIVAVSFVRVVILALLSIFNVYWVYPFIKQLGPDQYKRQFWAALVGFFGFVFVCPLMAAMLGQGLAVVIFAGLTGIHILVRVGIFKD